MNKITSSDCSEIMKMGQDLFDLKSYDQALVQFNKALKISQESYGENHLTTASVMGNIGTTLMNQNKLQEAETYLKKAYEIRESIASDYDAETILILGEYSNLLTMMKKYSLAEPLLLKNIEISKKFFGPNHPSVLDAMLSLANIYTDESRFSDAAETYSKVLKSKRETVGNTHPETLLCISNLAYVKKELNLLEESEALYLECLQLRETSLGSSHPDTISSMNNLANTQFNARHYDLAGLLFSKVLAWRRANLEPSHADVLTSICSLADTYYLQNKYTEAEPLYVEYIQRVVTIISPNQKSQNIVFSLEMCLEILLQKSINESYQNDILNCVSCLGNLYHSKEKYDIARQLFSCCLRITSSQYGLKDDRSIGYANEVADCYFCLGNIEEAEKLYFSVWRNLVEKRGEENDMTLTAYANLTSCYLRLKKLVEAEKAYKYIIERRTNTSGKKDSKVVSAKLKLATLYYTQRKFELVVPLLEDVIAVRQDTLGAMHPDTLNCLNNIANALFNQGLFEESLPRYEKCLEGRIKVLGENHANTIITRTSLQKVKEILKQKQESMDVSVTEDQIISMHHSPEKYSRKPYFNGSSDIDEDNIDKTQLPIDKPIVKVPVPIDPKPEIKEVVNSTPVPVVSTVKIETKQNLKKPSPLVSEDIKPRTLSNSSTSSGGFTGFLQRRGLWTSKSPTSQTAPARSRGGLWGPLKSVPTPPTKIDIRTNSNSTDRNRPDLDFEFDLKTKYASARALFETRSNSQRMSESALSSDKGISSLRLSQTIKKQNVDSIPDPSDPVINLVTPSTRTSSNSVKIVLDGNNNTSASAPIEFSDINKQTNTAISKDFKIAPSSFSLPKQKSPLRGTTSTDGSVNSSRSTDTCITESPRSGRSGSLGGEISRINIKKPDGVSMLVSNTGGNSLYNSTRSVRSNTTSTKTATQSTTDSPVHSLKAFSLKSNSPISKLFPQVSPAPGERKTPSNLYRLEKSNGEEDESEEERTKRERFEAQILRRIGEGSVTDRSTFG